MRSNLWQVEPWWRGGTCVILASGPSMSRAVADMVRPYPVRVIAVNRTYELAPWADIVYGTDALWWTAPLARLGGKNNHDMVGPHCIKVSLEQTPYDDMLHLKNTGKDGFDPDPSAIRSGSNSGYAAIHLAAHLGATTILLCGYDMRGGHWHEKHEPPLRDAGEGTFSRWVKTFDTLVPELKKRGVAVLNCTHGSALHCFPMADLKEALEARSPVTA